MDAPTPPSLAAMAGLATPMALRVAATLDLVDRAGTGATAEQLAAATGTAPGSDVAALRRLLAHLVTIGVFDQDGDRYRPTALADPLRADAPDSIRPYLDIHSAGGRAELAFVELLGTVTTGEPAYPRRYGRGFWADLDAHPALRRSFDAQMRHRFPTQAMQIAVRGDWGRFAGIVDVGGGDGALLTAIMAAHPDVRGLVLDLPPAAAAATERFAATGLRERATAVAGSFFDPLPAGRDAYLLSDILHDHDDDQALLILRRCAEAVTPDGAVLVIEPILGRGVGTDMDLFMLMCFGGRERTEDELSLLAADAGLSRRGATAVADGRTLLEFGRFHPVPRRADHGERQRQE